MTELEAAQKSARYWKRMAVRSWIALAITGCVCLAVIGMGTTRVMLAREEALSARAAAERERYAAAIRAADGALKKANQ
jgi:hypothetical protein